MTWVEGSTGLLSGEVSGAAIGTSHSLVGSSTGDFVAPYLRNLEQNRRLQPAVLTPLWDNGSRVDAGALTWINSRTGSWRMAPRAARLRRAAPC